MQRKKKKSEKKRKEKVGPCEELVPYRDSRKHISRLTSYLYIFRLEFDSSDEILKLKKEFKILHSYSKKKPLMSHLNYIMAVAFVSHVPERRIKKVKKKCWFVVCACLHVRE